MYYNISDFTGFPLHYPLHSTPISNKNRTNFGRHFNTVEKFIQGAHLLPVKTLIQQHSVNTLTLNSPPFFLQYIKIIQIHKEENSD